MSAPAPIFRGLNPYGSYDAAQKLPRGVCTISLDGTIRLVKRLGIPFARITRLEWAYGNHYFPRLVGYAIRNRDKRRLERALDGRDEKQTARTPAPHPDLLLCIREASRAAHRERDSAQGAYLCGCHTLAGNARKRKDAWYRMKERGIVAAHNQGLLRYVGVSPQGMAVYEYGEGGMACFHSTLHPAGVERTPVPDHPETLLVEAKDKVRGVSLRRVEMTLSALPGDFSGYERSTAPRIERPKPICHECGEEGHIARHCPNSDHDWDNYVGVVEFSDPFSADQPSS